MEDILYTNHSTYTERVKYHFSQKDVNVTFGVSGGGGGVGKGSLQAWCLFSLKLHSSKAQSVIKVDSHHDSKDKSYKTKGLCLLKKNFMSYKNEHIHGIYTYKLSAIGTWRFWLSGSGVCKWRHIDVF